MDLAEAIDTSDTSFLDNSEYNDADAIPLNGPLPTSHYVNNEVIAVICHTEYCYYSYDVKLLQLVVAFFIHTILLILTHKL